MIVSLLGLGLGSVLLSTTLGESYGYAAKLLGMYQGMIYGTLLPSVPPGAATRGAVLPDGGQSYDHKKHTPYMIHSHFTRLRSHISHHNHKVMVTLFTPKHTTLTRLW